MELLDDPRHALVVHEVGGEVRILANRLANRLGYPEPSRMLSLVPEDEQGVMEVGTAGGRQKAYYVTLPGLFRAVGQRQVSRIKDPQMYQAAQEFQRWLFHDVVPALATEGYYATPEYREALANKTLMLRGVLAASEQQDGRVVLSAGQAGLVRSEIADGLAAMAGRAALESVS